MLVEGNKYELKKNNNEINPYPLKDVDIMKTKKKEMKGESIWFQLSFT